MGKFDQIQPTWIIEDVFVKDYLLELFLGHKKTAHDKAPHNLQQEKWLATKTWNFRNRCLVGGFNPFEKY